MKLSRHSLLILVLLSSFLGVGLAVGQGSTRTIRYERNVPISKRLNATDTNVLVVKPFITPLAGDLSRESFEEEAKRVSQFDDIAIWQVSAARGELIDGGTWIRTIVNGQAVELVRRSAHSDSESTQFGHDGGTLMIGSVVVTAGVYPRFTAGERYLLFLSPGRTPGTMTFAMAFRLTPNGKLEAIELTDGTPLFTDSKFVGRSVADVLEVLR
jgi:hypothetical protein